MLWSDSEPASAVARVGLGLGLRRASGPPQPQIEAICGSCKETLIADRDAMIIATLPDK